MRVMDLNLSQQCCAVLLEHQHSQNSGTIGILFWGLLVVIEEKLEISFNKVPIWLRTSIYTIVIFGSIIAGKFIKSTLI